MQIGGTSAEAPAAPSTHPLQAWETTVVVQNLPGRYSQKEVLKLWPVDGTYDFLHAPYNLLHKRPLGYVFINFLTSELAAAFQKRWQGQLLPRGNNRKPLDIAAAEVQGMRANLELIKSRKIGQLAKAGFLPVVLKGARVLDSAEIAEELKELRSTKGKNPGKPTKDIALKDSRVRRLDLLRGKLRAEDEDRRSSSREGDSDDAQTTTTGSLSQASASAGASQQW